jgi:hypothetical protein
LAKCKLLNYLGETENYIIGDCTASILRIYDPTFIRKFRFFHSGVGVKITKSTMNIPNRHPKNTTPSQHSNKLQNKIKENFPSDVENCKYIEKYDFNVQTM